MAAPTIFALASGKGRAGVAVIRVSGPQVREAVHSLTGHGGLAPRRLTRCHVRDGAGNPIDDGLVVEFAAPASFTGEDVAEFHLHGGPAVVSAALEALASCPGLRPAEPGEFSRRAFDHGKMDLTAAEGLADLVNAETEAQRRQALHQMQGELANVYESWRLRLIIAAARLEAAIDFSDEDVPATAAPEAVTDAAALAVEISQHLADGVRGERVRDGIRVAILGPPNAGKSTLLNRLAGRDAAIVSHTPGTTRDVIEVHLDLGGYPVVVCDTAGLRPACEKEAGEMGEDAIEAEGIRRSRQVADLADLKLVVLDGAFWPDMDAATLQMCGPSTILVVNKIDLGRVPPVVSVGGQAALGISAAAGAGIGELEKVLQHEVSQRFESTGGAPLTRLRHRLALEECRDALERGCRAVESELAAEDLRLGARALGRITGRVDVEDILDVVFREFCIGK